MSSGWGSRGPAGGRTAVLTVDRSLFDSGEWPGASGESVNRPEGSFPWTRHSPPATRHYEPLYPKPGRVRNRDRHGTTDRKLFIRKELSKMAATRSYASPCAHFATMGHGLKTTRGTQPRVSPDEHL